MTLLLSLNLKLNAVNSHNVTVVAVEHVPFILYPLATSLAKHETGTTRSRIPFVLSLTTRSHRFAAVVAATEFDPFSVLQWLPMSLYQPTACHVVLPPTRRIESSLPKRQSAHQSEQSPSQVETEDASRISSSVETTTTVCSGALPTEKSPHPLPPAA